MFLIVRECYQKVTGEDRAALWFSTRETHDRLHYLLRKTMMVEKYLGRTKTDVSLKCSILFYLACVTLYLDLGGSLLLHSLYYVWFDGNEDGIHVIVETSISVA